MRKKYLSALLFGALLFASAGTFTSCKDYDDDINNLQSQINTINTTLSELKAQIGDGGVSSVTFDEATGVLTVVDANGTKTYTVKTSAGEVGEIKVTIDGQNLVVNGETVGKVGDTVTVNEDGYLCVNGVATEIKAGKYAILENVSDNTYTITLPDENGDMQTIQLLRAIPTDLQVVIKNDDDYQVFTEVLTSDMNGGLAWGTAANDVNWAGPKGAVKKGQLLVGQQNAVKIGILPSTTELDAQVLKLVDSEGNVAPVNVVATPANVNGLANTGNSRAKDSKGEWNLQVVMTSDVTKDNIGSTFATENNTSNKAYALSVNGVVLTDYVFVVDTDKSAFSFTATPLEYKGVAANDGKGVQIVIDGVQKTLKAGTVNNGVAKLEINDATATTLPLNKAITLKYVDPSVYDYQFVIAKEDQNDAEKYGITVKNNVLTADNKAADLKEFTLDVILMGVDGKVVDKTGTDVNKVELAFGNATVDAEEIAAVTYTVSAKALVNQFIKVDLGTTFSALTADEAVSLTDDVWSVNDSKANEFLIDIANKQNSITYYSDEACTKEVGFDDTADNIKNIKYALIPVTAENINASANVGTTTRQSTIKPGDYTLTLNLKAGNNEVKKVKVPVSIKLPSFDDLFTKSAAWADDAISIRLDGTGKGDFYTAFTYNGSTNSPVTAAFDKLRINNVDKSVVSNDKVTCTTDPTFTITADVIDIYANQFRTPKVEISCLVQNIDNFKIKSEKVDVKFLTALDGAKIVNYVDGTASSTFEIEGSGKTFKAVYVDDNKKKQGVALIQNGMEYKLDTEDVKISEMLSLDADNWSSQFGSLAGKSAEATVSSDNETLGDLTFTSLSANSYTEDAYLIYPAVTIGTGNNAVSIYTPVAITIKVNGGK